MLGNWNDISKVNNNNAQSTTPGNVQTITGITGSINLYIAGTVDSAAEQGMGADLQIFKNGTMVSMLELSTLDDASNISVSNNDTIQFKLVFSYSLIDQVLATISVYNDSNGSTLLDSFTINAMRI